MKASGRVPCGVNHGVFVLSKIVIVLNPSTHGSRASGGQSIRKMVRSGDEKSRKQLCFV